MMARKHKAFPRLSIDSLRTEEHRRLFSRALQNVLSSDTAELTYGQIVDGLPISSVEEDSYYGTVSRDHPIHKNHTELCSGVLERLRNINGARDISTLEFDSTLIDAYNNTSLGSRAFQARLIEMTVYAVHQIAVQLFRTETSIHDEKDGMGWWEDPKRERMPPTLFQHHAYCDYHLFPEDLADGVAYWAENRIFGGVVLFDRRAPGSSPNSHNGIRVDPNAIYLHSDRDGVTNQIYQLTDRQRCDLVNFLLSETTPPAKCPIPMKATWENDKRIDPQKSHLDTGVY
ncbi:hypothetical protein F5Y07DRAFT_379353 [Xylaria sp. FL0933]|nr:hypothetical protein F5Y07DRAFT_379353 [Xylaria sp. FL0933]